MKRNPMSLVRYGLILASWGVVAIPAGAAGPAPSRESLAGAARSNNALAADLYQALTRGGMAAGDNLVISPHGLGANLAILHAGARGETAAALAKVLRLAPGQEAPTRGIGRIAEAMAALRPSRSGAVLSAGKGGPQVDAVLAGTPADLARLRPGDRIVSVGGKPTPTPEAFEAAILPLEGSTPFEAIDGKTGKRFKAKLPLPPLSGAGRAAPPTLTQAHSVWLQKGGAFRPEFLAALKDLPSATARQADFAQHTDQAIAEINAWVDDATAHKIPVLFDSLSPSTSMVSAGAIYFKGAWATPFDPANSKSGPFRVRPDRKADVTFMEGTLEVRLAEPAGEGLLALELPYRDSTLAMEIYLPDATHDLAQIEPKLTAENLARWSAQLHAAVAEPVKLTLPRFRLDSKLALNQALSGLGLAAAFASGADFGGISGEKSTPLSEVLQRSFVEVNEQGTEAAAATGASTARVSPRTILVDRPFVFVIRDTYSGTIFFQGRVADPSR